MQTVAMLYDSQAHELHTKHSAEAMKAEKWQFEYKNLNDKYDALLKEKEVSLMGCKCKKKHLEKLLLCCFIRIRLYELCLLSWSHTGVYL